MASNRHMTFSMSLRFGDDFMPMRLPVASANLQVQLLHRISDACAGFLQDLTGDDIDLARQLEEGMADIANFREQVLRASFHNVVGGSSDLQGIPESSGSRQEADLELGARSRQGSASDDDEASDTECLPLRRAMVLTPSDAETFQREGHVNLQPVGSAHDAGEDVSIPESDPGEEGKESGPGEEGEESGPGEEGKESGPGEEGEESDPATDPSSTVLQDGSESEPQQAPALFSSALLQELSMKPMDFQSIVPSQQSNTSGWIPTPSRVISSMQKVKWPKLKAWHRSFPAKISPDDAEPQQRVQSLQ
eukprot:TRINITY_DN5462_c0_g1_i1.p1 TRINITY_DN5462_c0_g1~~TRINITY_DN5462_c0_g1_i1.p1  ORF type:complete len:307 (-),score=77.95 TRINITY_DN5462_c0_g1_i1:20-940(-)